MVRQPTANPNPAPARGRPATSKPLVTAAKAKQTPSSAPTSKVPLVEKKIQKTSSSNSAARSKPSEQTPGTSKSTKTPIKPASDSKPRENIDKPSKPTEPVPPIPTPEVTIPPPSPLPQPTEEKAATPAPDALQVAAQIYPWMYMTSTLEACFQTAQETAHKDLEARAHQLEEEESSISDQRTRFEAERAVDFYDELGTDMEFATKAPSIIQKFLSHGDACTRAEAEALQLATQGASEPDEDAPLRIYNEMLDNLEELHAEALQLESSILELTETKNDESSASSTSAAQSQILGVFSACLPVLRARISNLSMAQELIDGAQENLSISLRMESLGLLG